MNKFVFDNDSQRMVDTLCLLIAEGWNLIGCVARQVILGEVVYVAQLKK